MSNFEKKKLNRTCLYSKEKKLFVDFLLFVQSLFVKFCLSFVCVSKSCRLGGEFCSMGRDFSLHD